MSNQANFIATNYPLHELNIFEESAQDLSTDWANGVSESHDAHYILRKRSLLLDLCNLEAPYINDWQKSATEENEAQVKSLRDFIQQEFIQEYLEEKDALQKAILLQNSIRIQKHTPNMTNMEDMSWHLDCHMTVQ